MDTRKDHRANRLRVVGENERTDQKKNRVDARQAVLPGLENTLRRTVETDTARAAFDKTLLAVRGALQVASKVAAVDVAELRAVHIEFKDADKRLEAAELANLKAPSDVATQLVEQLTIQRDHALDRLKERRKTSTPVQGAIGAIIKAANVAGNHELGDKVGTVHVTGTTAFDKHLETTDEDEAGADA